MSYSQIRINKTNELLRILKDLKKCYPLLSETEIVKVALSDLYIQKMDIDMEDECDFETVVDFTDNGKTIGMPAEEVLNVLHRINSEGE